MDLLQNPFRILAASSRDNRRRLMELADERSLLFDAEECLRARSELTNPRKRLSAEVAWMPGIAPKRANDVLLLLETSVSDILGLENMPTIAKANLLATGLSRLPDYEAGEVSQWIFKLAYTYEAIDAEEVCALINEDRIVSGFPEVTDLSAVETEIEERRRYFRTVIKSALDNLFSQDLIFVVTCLVETATCNGEELGPILIDDIVDSYEVEAQEFLEKEASNIKAIVEHIQTAANLGSSNSTLTPIVNQLTQTVANWGTVAKPIQVSAKSRGLKHEESQMIAYIVRNLAIDLFNKHDKIEFAQQLTNMLQENFTEVVEVAERIAEDTKTLANIAGQREQRLKEADKRDAERRREITYEADVGILFKDRLSISPEGIDWKGRRWKLDSISLIRWGGTKHYTNGIPTGTTYDIVFGSPTEICSIELRQQKIYENFIDRLWRAVGVRLLYEHLEGLRDGKKYAFGSVVMSDYGMELERTHFFSKNERVFCQWSELAIWNSPGCFCIGKKTEKGLSTALSYTELNNIHVLEALLRAFWKQGGGRISKLLEGE